MSAATAAGRIAAAVRAIPRGQVRSYAQVAAMAGLPWHRVVRADGRIAFPPGSDAAREQAHRLRAEGVGVTAGRVDAGWRPAPARDLLLWGP